MKLTSLSHTLLDLLRLLKRFPAAVVATMAGTIVAMVLLGRSTSFYEENYPLINLLLTCSLMLPAFVALQLFFESWEAKPKSVLAAMFLLVSIFAVYFYTLPAKLSNTHYLFFFLINLALHLGVAFSPFAGRGNENGFWQFNKVLFIRVLAALLYSHVLFIGLALALLAMENLFNIDLNDRIYGRLWIFIIGIFNTLFFLSGIPSDVAALEKEQAYPRGLKVFTQYVLLPLVFIYLVILYAYAGKIVVQWDWPQGWVSYLVLGFSGLGILSFLLIHPLQGTAGNKWIALFLKWFYLLLVPLIILLGLAVFRRIYEYGFTENRYFLVILTAWLAGITAYFLFGQEKKIKVIPVSLCTIALLISFGPWGAFRTAMRSQTSRFEKVLDQNQMLNQGLIIKPISQVSFRDQKQLSSILRFLENRNALGEVRHYFPQAADSIFSEASKVYDKTRRLTEGMGIQYIPDWQTEEYAEESDNFYLNASFDDQLDISGYDLLMPFDYNQYRFDSEVKTYDSLKVIFKAESNLLEFFAGGENIGMIPIDPSLATWKEKYPGNTHDYDIASEELSIVEETQNHRFKLYILALDAKEEEGKLKIYNFHCTILVGKK